MAKLTWQRMGGDAWVFGEPVRGVVRFILAEIYFDEELDGPDGGWVWFVNDRVVGELKDTILKQDRVIAPLQAQVAERDKLVRQQGEEIERLNKACEELAESRNRYLLDQGVYIGNLDEARFERDHWKRHARDLADARDGWMGQCGKLESERDTLRKQLQQAEQQRQDGAVAGDVQESKRMAAAGYSSAPCVLCGQTVALAAGVMISAGPVHRSCEAKQQQAAPTYKAGDRFVVKDGDGELAGEKGTVIGLLRLDPGFLNVVLDSLPGAVRCLRQASLEKIDEPHPTLPNLPPSDNALFVEVMGRVRDRGFELADALHQILARGLGL